MRKKIQGIPNLISITNFLSSVCSLYPISQIKTLDLAINHFRCCDFQSISYLEKGEFISVDIGIKLKEASGQISSEGSV